MIFIVTLNVIVWRAVVAGPEAGTRITILDTSKITTIFTEEPSGKTTLINGGGKSRFFDNGESVVSAIPTISRHWIHQRSLLDISARRKSPVLGTIREATRSHDHSISDTHGDSLKYLNPAIQLQWDSLCLVFVTEAADVESLNTSLCNANILGLTWSFLANNSAEASSCFSPKPSYSLTTPVVMLSATNSLRCETNTLKSRYCQYSKAGLRHSGRPWLRLN